LIGIAGVLEVRSCPHGRGVFALRQFDEGELIQSLGGMIITTSPKSPQRKGWALIVGNAPGGKHLFWDEEPKGSPGYWSNYLDHSGTANVRFLIDMSRLSATLVATGNIKTGEELLLDYKESHADNWTPASGNPQAQVVCHFGLSRRM
jgi:hypothetical protein